MERVKLTTEQRLSKIREICNPEVRFLLMLHDTYRARSKIYERKYEELKTILENEAYEICDECNDLTEYCECEEEEPVCSTCNGSGEGIADGSSCPECNSAARKRNERMNPDE